MMAKIKFCFCILAMLYIGCAGSGQWAKKIGWVDCEFESLPTAAEYPAAEALLLLDEGQMLVHSNKEFSFSNFSQHRLIKILNRRGLKWADITLPYSSQTKVKNIKARTISPSGKITLLEKQDIFDINLYPDYIFYSDVRAKKFTLPAVEIGSVIEYSFEKDKRLCDSNNAEGL